MITYAKILVFSLIIFGVSAINKCHCTEQKQTSNNKFEKTTDEKQTITKNNENNCNNKINIADKKVDNDKNNNSLSVNNIVVVERIKNNICNQLHKQELKDILTMLYEVGVKLSKRYIELADVIKQGYKTKNASTEENKAYKDAQSIMFKLVDIQKYLTEHHYKVELTYESPLITLEHLLRKLAELVISYNKKALININIDICNAIKNKDKYSNKTYRNKIRDTVIDNVSYYIAQMDHIKDCLCKICIPTIIFIKSNTGNDTITKLKQEELNPMKQVLYNDVMQINNDLKLLSEQFNKMISQIKSDWYSVEKDPKDTYESWY